VSRGEDIVEEFCNSRRVSEYLARAHGYLGYPCRGIVISRCRLSAITFAMMKSGQPGGLGDAEREGARRRFGGG